MIWAFSTVQDLQQSKTLWKLTMGTTHGKYRTTVRILTQVQEMERTDVTDHLLSNLLAFQETHKQKGCCKSKSKCQRSCGASCEKKKDLRVLAEGTQWYQPASVQVRSLSLFVSCRKTTKHEAISKWKRDVCGTS